MRLLRPALWCATLLSVVAATAQEPTAVPAPALEAPGIEPVPLPRVAEQGEETERAARKLEALAAPVPELKQIEETLPEQSVQLQERAKRAKTLASDPASLVALEEVGAANSENLRCVRHGNGGKGQRGIQTQPVRRISRRPHTQEFDLLLRFLGEPAPANREILCTKF